MDYRRLRATIERDAAALAAFRQQDYPAVAARLNERPLIDNPEPQGQVLVPIKHLGAVMGLLPRSERRAIIRAGLFKDLVDRAWSAGDSPEVDALTAWVAQSGTVQFEQVTIVELANALLDEPQLLAALVQALVADGKLSQATAQALADRLAQTEPDPAWQAQVPGPSLAAQAGLLTVRPADVQHVDNYPV